MKIKYFFSHGIRFECIKCGKCCTGEPGTVYVSREEIRDISKFLGIDEKKFCKQFLYPFRDSYSIKELEDGRCVFFHQEKGCLIHAVKPLQCSTYPFWFKNLRNEKRWSQIEKECPGIGRGRLYSEEDILEIIARSPL